MLASQNWILNNVMGVAFCFNAIEMISLERFVSCFVHVSIYNLIHPFLFLLSISSLYLSIFSVSVGCILLGGLFIYDIFWVN